jgi:hypothetical protein
MAGRVVVTGWLVAFVAAGCTFSDKNSDGGDYNGDGRVGFSDLQTSRSDASYVPTDTRTSEQRLEDHMDRQKGGDEYERERRSR